MKIFDISRPLFNGLAPWPGDTAFHFDLKWKMAEGATVNVGAVTMGVHNGSHADAPFHFQPGAATIEQMPLETYFGEATVVDLTSRFKSGERHDITIADLDSVPRGTARVLLKTGVWADSKTFPQWIPVIARDVSKWLEGRKVKLLGFDLPSVDSIEAKVLVNHHALAAANIAIIESLDLSEVEAGTYQFS
ncbi:MAG TPA: cyclase family protein, partial [Chthoniobacterales bacterium]